MTIVSLLFTGLLFGGMMLYSFGFAGFLFKNTTAEEAGRLLRLAFPLFYLFVILVALTASLMALPVDRLASTLLLLVGLTTLPARQVLMPAINAARDRGDTRRFNRLHGTSVALGVVQIAAVGWALARLGVA